MNPNIIPEAVGALREFGIATARATDRPTKAAKKRERVATAKLLKMLLGRKPTDEEIDEALTW